jgi:hypothetical protein
VSAPRSSSSLRLPRSVAPADVGVDALIEIVASAVVVWQLQESGPGFASVERSAHAHAAARIGRAGLDGSRRPGDRVGRHPP